MRQMVMVGALALVATALHAQEKQIIEMPGASLGLPFSTAVRVGNVIYLSGQVGVKPGTRELAAGGIGPETRQALENIKAVLTYAGSSMDRIVKCTVFLKDIADFAAMNEVYTTFFPRDPPARSTVAGSGLALGARVEIECIALPGAGPAPGGPDKQAIQPGGMLSTAMRVGPMLYLSGQLGTDPETRQLALGGIGPETRQSLENIKRVVEQAGSSMDRVVKCTVFLADIADFAAMNEVYTTFFPRNPPARSTVAVSGLVRGARVEIECLGLAAA